MLEMKNICKDYPQGKMTVHVLKNVSLQVEEGDYLAIMGPSGSGKTTLMNLIGCLDVPTSGTYLLNGEDIGKLKSGKLAQVRNQTLGFVFQSFYLLPKLSAVDNVALPLLYAGVPKKERRARAEIALRKMGLGDRMRFRPNQLSGGQCQRVAIARAIVTNPKLLLADEPTGALDSASGSQIMDIFDELYANGVTIIMITHEQEVAARAKRICHIRDGVLTGGAESSNEAPRKDDGGETYDLTASLLPEDHSSEKDFGITSELDVGISAGAAPISDEPDGLSVTRMEEDPELMDFFRKALVDPESKDIPADGKKEDVFADPQREDVFASPEPEDVFADPEREDVFASPEPEDVFADPQREDVFASPEPEDVFAPSEEEDVFAASERGDVFDTPDGGIDFMIPGTGVIATEGNGEEGGMDV
ncbi:MAG: ATP-binding cassette domain-containing protein [Oscillospiraceae bacterium]|nr:ATP-binding cassette domain-containing protein [Oscillospiraceae bacterium]